MGLCSVCGVEHSRFRDRAHQRPQSKCQACHNAYMRANRPLHCELSAEDRRKSNARSYANCYQRRGKIVPQPCEVCGGVAQKHHEDYGQPLQVRWLCVVHHISEHRGEPLLLTA